MTGANPGEPAELPHSPSGIVGIVGTGPDGIVLFTKTEIGVFAPDSGTFTPFVPARQEDRDAIARMRLPVRSYGNDFTVRQLGTDIMIEKNGIKGEIAAEGDRFGQPSVSHDRKHIVYVRTRK